MRRRSPRVIAPVSGDVVTLCWREEARDGGEDDPELGQLGDGKGAPGCVGLEDDPNLDHLITMGPNQTVDLVLEVCHDTGCGLRDDLRRLGTELALREEAGHDRREDRSQATSAEDEKQAQVESDYVKHVIFAENDGFMAFNTAFKDALLAKLLINGFSGTAFPEAGDGLAYTGKTFFATDHSLEGGSATISNRTTSAFSEAAVEAAIQTIDRKSVV